MTVGEILNAKIKEIEKDFGKNIGTFLETKDEGNFLMVLDFFETVPIGQIMKYVSLLLNLEEEFKIKTVHCLPMFNKNMIIWVGSTDSKFFSLTFPKNF